jgi:hypothetical protein
MVQLTSARRFRGSTTFLVADAALDRRVGAEDSADGLAQRLGAVEHDEHAPRLTADFDVERELASISEPTGSPVRVSGASRRQ